MTRRAPVWAIFFVAAFVAAFAAGCGGGDSTSPDSVSDIPTTSIGSSHQETTAVSGDTSDPKNDAFACALLSAADIGSAAGSAAQTGSHPGATVLQGEALTSCTVKSVADCPQNLTKESPYCDKAYQVQWSVDVYPTENAAKLTFVNDQRGGDHAAVEIAGADEATYYSGSGAVEARKGAGLLRITFQGPGSLSGNTGVAARVMPQDEQPAEKLAAIIVGKLP